MEDIFLLQEGKYLPCNIVKSNVLSEHVQKQSFLDLHLHQVHAKQYNNYFLALSKCYMEWNTHSVSLPLKGTSLHRFGKKNKKNFLSKNIFVIIIMILSAALFFFLLFFPICRLILRHVQPQNVYWRSRLFNLLQAHDRFCLRKSSFNLKKRKRKKEEWVRYQWLVCGRVRLEQPGSCLLFAWQDGRNQIKSILWRGGGGGGGGGGGAGGGGRGCH